MNTKTLSQPSLELIDSYERFSVGGASCSVPYFNNKAPGNRASLRVYIGKGNPKDIQEEAAALFIKHHVDPNKVDSTSLKKFLVESGLGIDCSGFAYYVLGEESRARKLGQIDRKMSFVDCKGIIGKLRCALRPVENCSVSTFANDTNSRSIDLDQVEPGDMIIMKNTQDDKIRDHMLIIYAVDYQNSVPMILKYAHAVTYPEDGLYSNGIRRGIIEIVSTQKSLLEARWTEESKEAENNPLFNKARKSELQLRRLGWF